ncbi:fatty acid-binding protein [Agrilus planipennis]|uniref:Fatty acid-binding protein n=1 Tax=Agrilus planipennis TaxID=224129 RepID=A0A1W4WFN5_AGRPL|nr:fatty acid-binding protein [Agrilus planipennis]XP_018318821.1 fatty acid-binding protein [Agrilus planipennis]XP_025832645.1 fatty acid-binding protein [Agrilus planipennis]
MSLIVGNYVHEKNENLEEFYKAAGIPFIPRKMMLASHPSMQITVNEEGEWSITTVTLVRTHITKFKLGEEYEETMPGNVQIKNVTTKEENKLVTISTGPDGSRSLRIYEFSDTGAVITLRHEPTGVEGRRYFKRV